MPGCNATKANIPGNDSSFLRIYIKGYTAVVRLTNSSLLKLASFSFFKKKSKQNNI